MSAFAADSDPEIYIEHLEWVRALALRLVGDHEEADDLRQEVWLLAQRLQHPITGSPRQWLGGLLRNVVRERRRARSTRSLHEERAAIERAVSSEESPVVREVSIQQVVVDQVLRLQEPYRSTILARYYEDLGPEEIAKRDGIPVATVKTRLRRGLAMLRGDLREREAKGTNALAALALVVWPAEAQLVSAAAAPTLALPAALFVGLLAIAAGFVLRGRAGADPVAEPNEVVVVSSPANEPSSEPIAAAPERSRQRVPVAVVEPPPLVPADSTVVEVVDLEGTRVPGIEVRFVETVDAGVPNRGPWAVTDDEGRARIVGVTGTGALECRGEGWLQFGFPMAVEVASERTVVAVVAPELVLRGRIRDGAGEPIPGAFVEVGLSGSYAARIGRPLDRVALERFIVDTDANGAFEISVPDDPNGLVLKASRPGYHVVGRSLDPLEWDDEIEVTLDAIRDPSVLFGVVIDGDEHPVSRAWVSNGTSVVRADVDGRFQFGSAEGGDTLAVGAPGRAPKLFPHTDPTSPIQLVLDAPARGIRGRVVDPAGAPVAGVWVYPPKLDVAGVYEFSYLGRSARMELALESFGQPETSGTVPPSVAVMTDDAGQFELTGLRPLDYALEIFDPATLARSPAQTVPAGASTAELVAAATPRPFDGRVVDTGGAPLEGVTVQSYAVIGDARSNSDQPGPAAVSDADGRFRFTALARGSLLRADAGAAWLHVGEQAIDPPPGGAFLLTIEPAARVQLVIDASPGALEPGRVPTSFRFRDTSGFPIEHVVDDIHREFRDTGELNGALDQGRFRPLPVRVPTRASELILLDDDGILLVVPLQLDAGEDLELEL
ncbi:MAG: sigma-70 family RNA polymerase sigma factor [Planctomycetota bacterium]